jgi:hypothetical protein
MFAHLSDHTIAVGVGTGQAGNASRFAVSIGLAMLMLLPPNLYVLIIRG